MSIRDLTDRDLDARVAKALGWANVSHYTQPDDQAGLPPPELRILTLVPRYSTDGNAMLALLGELRERRVELDISIGDAPGREWEIEFDRPYRLIRSAPKLPRAVAEAAVLALGGGE